MKKTVLRVLSLMLAAIMLFSMMIACSDQTDTPDGSQDTSANTPADTTVGGNSGDAGNTADTTTAVPETTSPYDENGYLKDTLSPDLNFKDYEFNILGWNTSQPDFYVEMDTGDTVIDTIFFRNLAVEDRLGVKISANLIDGDNKAQAAFVEHAMAAILAGGNCAHKIA